MSFLDIALRNAARRFRVMPIKGKNAFLLDWPNVATTDELQIRAWAEQYPDCNCGVAGGPGIAILDSDRVSRLKELSGDHAAEWFNTYSVTSGRQDRAHFYFRMTDEVRAFGNKRWAEQGIDGNVFEVKVQGGQVAAEGSTHPDTGAVYTVTQDLPLIPFPAGLMALIRECYATTNPTGKREWSLPVHDGEGRDDYFISQAGKLRNAGASEAIIRAQLEEWNADPSIMADPKSEGDLDRIARSAARYDVPATEPHVTIGKSSTPHEVGEDIELVEELDQSLTATPLPTYPKTVFEGTLYLEFAKRASQGNYVPLEFFIEGAMTYAGAIAGDQLHGMAEEITPRLYTVFIAPPGIGKGTTFRRIRKFAPSLRLLNAVPEKFVPSCSALADRAGSENGLNDALLNCPRVIEEFEELDRLMEKTSIVGSGKALMSIIRTCFDDTVPGITTTAGRPVAANLAFLSLLGAITPSLWRSAMEGRDSYGSGLGGRFNLVASNEDRTASTLTSMQLGDLQDQLERKFVELESHDTTIPTERAALKVLDEWWIANSRGKPHYNRVNVITHRKALHLAWIRGLPIITAEIMQQAIQLADYLVAVRDVFAVAPGEDRTAICENRILNVLRQISPKAVRPKQVVELLDCLASRNTVLRALDSLANSGEAEKIVRKDASSKKPYAVFRLNPK
jgi:hypothetical protein